MRTKEIITQMRPTKCPTCNGYTNHYEREELEIENRTCDICGKSLNDRDYYSDAFVYILSDGTTKDLCIDCEQDIIEPYVEKHWNDIMSVEVERYE